MSNMNRTVLCVIFLVFPLMFACGGSKKTAEEVTLQRPSFLEYYEKGITAYSKGDYEEALTFFEMSLDRNPDYSPSGEFLGLSFLAIGELDKAYNRFDLVLERNAYSVNARIGAGRILLSRGDYESALYNFKIVTDHNTNSAEAWFYTGLALDKAGNWFRSRTAFARAEILDPSYSTTISQLTSKDQLDSSKLFQEEILRIELKQSVTRADVAAISGILMQNSSVFSNAVSAENKNISDVSPDHWAYFEISQVVEFGLFDLYPDEKFMPTGIMLKADFASMLQIIVIKMRNDPRLAVRFVNENSPFIDINSSHWAYNACRLAQNMELLQPAQFNQFGINDVVSGYSVILSLEKLSEMHN